MGLFDVLKNSLKNQATQSINSAVNSAGRQAANSIGTAVGNAAKKAVSNASLKKETFTFAALPTGVEQLKAMPEADCATPFKTAALTVAVLCHYGTDPAATVEMLNVLKGPQPLSPREIQFLQDRLKGRDYLPKSFFAGTSPQNNYTPATPYTITVSEYAYSYQHEGYCTLELISSGADSPRQIQLRRKGEQWFLWENYLLSDIRIPVAEAIWA